MTLDYAPAAGEAVEVAYAVPSERHPRPGATGSVFGRECLALVAHSSFVRAEGRNGWWDMNEWIYIAPL